MSQFANNIYFKILLSVVVTLLVFIADLITPLGVADGVPYILLLITGLLYDKPLSILILAGVATLLIFIGWYYSPGDPRYYKVVVNRISAVTLIWVGSIALYAIVRSRELLKTKNNELAEMMLELKQQVDTLDASAIVSVTDVKGDVMYVNDLFSKISGYSRKEITGKNHRILKSGKQPDGLFKGMWAAIGSGQIWHGEICNRRKDGSYYWVFTTIVPFRDNENRITKYVSVRFDVTKLKEYEQRIKKRSQELELKNEKLKSANLELESFSYSVSHDLKAPLRALQGFSNNLSIKYADQLDEDGQRWLEFIRSNAERMDELIGDILRFSRLCRTEINKKEVDVNQVIKEVYGQIHPSYKQTIELAVDELPNAYADEGMMEVIWQNLIDNALKYSSYEEIIKINIQGWEEDTFNHYMINDNGVGFDMRHYHKLFGIFERLHRNDEFQGTGVGLANVQRIISKHNGTIKAKGEVGKGATFEFKIPKKLML